MSPLLMNLVWRGNVMEVYIWRCGRSGEVSFPSNGTITLRLKELTTGLSAQMEELAWLLAKHFEKQESIERNMQAE